MIPVNTEVQVSPMTGGDSRPAKVARRKLFTDGVPWYLVLYTDVEMAESGWVHQDRVTVDGQASLESIRVAQLGEAQAEADQARYRVMQAAKLVDEAGINSAHMDLLAAAASIDEAVAKMTKNIDRLKGRSPKGDNDG